MLHYIYKLYWVSLQSRAVFPSFIAQPIAHAVQPFPLHYTTCRNIKMCTYREVVAQIRIHESTRGGSMQVKYSGASAWMGGWELACQSPLSLSTDTWEFTVVVLPFSAAAVSYVVYMQWAQFIGRALLQLIYIVNANVIVATYFAEFRMQCNEIKNCQLLSKESAIFKVNM